MHANGRPPPAFLLVEGKQSYDMAKLKKKNKKFGTAIEKEVVISTSKSIPRRDIARNFPFQMPPLWGRVVGESPLLA